MHITTVISSITLAYRATLYNQAEAMTEEPGNIPGQQGPSHSCHKLQAYFFLLLTLLQK